MAKSKAPQESTVHDMRRYHAESMVSDAVKQSPQFKKEVTRVMGEIEAMEKRTRANVTKKREKG